MPGGTATILAEALAAAALPRIEARILIEHVTGWTSATVLAHPERTLNPQDAARFASLCRRRRAGEPIAYLIGEREFYGLAFEVSPAVLIPRPETELLVDRAIAVCPSHAGAVLDLGTGSGAIAIAIAVNLPRMKVHAVDVSFEALELARRNAARHGVSIRFAQGNWFDAVPGARFDVIVSNPPYVAAGDPHLAQGDVRHEPGIALIGGADGLDPIRAICARAAAHLLEGGQLWFEHGFDQAARVARILRRHGFERIRTSADLAGLPRVTGGAVPARQMPF